MQVRLGTKGGSRVVKVAVIALYFFLFAFGLIKALPFTCIVSPLIGEVYDLTLKKWHFLSFCFIFLQLSAWLITQF
jgi:hypothetical protein